jgi:hypothetical protein
MVIYVYVIVLFPEYQMLEMGFTPELGLAFTRCLKRIFFNESYRERKQ